MAGMANRIMEEEKAAQEAPGVQVNHYIKTDRSWKDSGISRKCRIKSGLEKVFLIILLYL